MMHAINMWHEQSRADRDEYVTINWNNLDQGQSNVNYVKQSTYDRNPYDFASALQYGLYVSEEINIVILHEILLLLITAYIYIIVICGYIHIS